MVETAEGPGLKTIIDVANNCGCQYIVAVMKEKLDSSHMSAADQQRFQIIQLSDDRLFEDVSVEQAEADHAAQEGQPHARPRRTGSSAA